MQAIENKGAATNSLIQSQLSAIEDIASYFGNQPNFKRLAILGLTQGLNAIESQDVEAFRASTIDIFNPLFCLDIETVEEEEGKPALTVHNGGTSMGFDLEDEEADLAAKSPPASNSRPQQVMPALTAETWGVKVGKPNPKNNNTVTNSAAPPLGFTLPKTQVAKSPIVELYEKKETKKASAKAKETIATVAPKAAPPTPASIAKGEEQTEWEILMEQFEQAFLKAKSRFERYSKGVENLAPLKDYYYTHHETLTFKNFLNNSLDTLKYAVENRGLDAIAIQKLMDVAYNDVHSEIDRIVAHCWVMVKIWDDRDRLKLGTPKAIVPNKTFQDIPKNLNDEQRQAFEERILSYRLAEKAEYMLNEMTAQQRECFDRSVNLFPDYTVERIYHNSLRILPKESYLNPAVDDALKITNNVIIFADFCHYRFFDNKEQQQIRDRYKAFCSKNNQASPEEKGKIFLDIIQDYAKKQLFPDLIPF